MPTILTHELPTRLGYRPNGPSVTACDDAVMERAITLNMQPVDVVVDVLLGLLDRFPTEPRPLPAQHAITLAALLSRKYMSMAFATATAQEVPA